MKKLLYLAIAALSFAACSRPYVVVQIADAQFGFTASDKCEAEGVEYDFDVKYERECLTKAVALVNDIKPDAVVFTGDQVHHALHEQEWKAFRRVIYGIDKDIDVFHLPGNHDVQVWDPALNIKTIGDHTIDMQPYELYNSRSQFCHEEKGLALVGINSNLVKYEDPREGDQFAWLQKVLDLGVIRLDARPDIAYLLRKYAPSLRRLGLHENIRPVTHIPAEYGTSRRHSVKEK